MPALFRRHTNISCFFCQSPNLIPKNPRNFRCPGCGCWNRYDEHGEIISDEPAMHDEALNSRSFAKRGSPSKDRLPTMYGKGPFCHTCQTNQMLLMNLLSNYLPPPDNPEHTRRLEMLPEYRENLHLRYPPVCDSCFPAVEDEIRRKDNMARTQALGGWLKESKGKEMQRRVSATSKGNEKIGLEMVAWRIRGCLWVATLITALVGNSTAAFGYRPPRQFAILQPTLPFFALLSVLWTVWDPTYSSFRSAKIQGRDVRVLGKNQYIALQMMAWASRVATSVLLALFWFRSHLDHLNLTHDPPSSRSRLYFCTSLALELFTFIASCVVLRLQQPPVIRLLDTNNPLVPLRASTPNPTGRPSPSPVPSLAEPDLLSALSLSSKPIIAGPNPVFGLPSLLSSVPPPPSTRTDEDADADEMDWTPTDPLSSPSAFAEGKHKAALEIDDGSWIRPQRFFAPEKPTGLEGLFERTRLVDDSVTSRRTKNTAAARERVGVHVWNWWVYALLLVPLAGATYEAWQRMNREGGFTSLVQLPDGQWNGILR